MYGLKSEWLSDRAGQLGPPPGPSGAPERTGAARRARASVSLEAEVRSLPLFPEAAAEVPTPSWGRTEIR